MTWFDRVRYAFRFGLVRQRLRYLVGRAGIVVVPYYWIREGGGTPALPPLADEQGYAFRFLAEEDFGAAAPVEPGLPAAALCARLRAGARCFGALYRDELAAFNWIDLDRCSFVARPVALAGDEAYLWGMHTRRPFRGRNLAPHLRARTYAALGDLGRTTFYSVSDALNPPANRFKRKLGARFLSLCVYVRLFGRVERHWVVRRYDRSKAGG